MVAQPFGQGNELLAQIRAGMVVFDAAGEHVGTIRRVYPGTVDLNEATLVAGTDASELGRRWRPGA